MSGGPIEARITMVAARLVMHSWSRRYSGILLRAGLRLPYHGGYVDDGRQGSTTLRLGTVFNEEKKKFEVCQIQKVQDKLTEIIFHLR